MSRVLKLWSSACARALAALAILFVSIGPLQSPASAQTSPSAYTTYFRWDAMHRLVGQIGADADGAGPLTYPAERYTYDVDGNLIRSEKGKLSAWQAATIAPSAWTGFSVLAQVDYSYNLLGQETQEIQSDNGTNVTAITQYSYDAAGRQTCVAVRMNFASPPSAGSDACVLGTAGSFGPDRITKTVYDAASNVVQIQKAVGVSGLQQNYATYQYGANGKQVFVTDANGNKARLCYDGLDRQSRWVFPSKTVTGSTSGVNDSDTTCAVNAASDYEEYGYDANANRTSLRKRDAQAIAYGFDALNRMTLKNLPGTAIDVIYSYDLLGRQLTAKYQASGQGLTNTYDNAGRLSSATSTTGGASRALSYLYDKDGDRTRVTHPGGTIYFTYTYDGLDRAITIQDNGGATLASLTYDDLGRRKTLGQSAGSTSNYDYDAGSRLSCLRHDIAGGSTLNCTGPAASGSDYAATFNYNPASQVYQRTLANDAYAHTRVYTASRSYARNGLNQYTQISSTLSNTSPAYDANGNLTGFGSTSYSYDTENRLTGASGDRVLALSYAPTGRLFQTSGGVNGTTQFLYDGDALVAEYSAGGTLLRRYVHGPNTDEPLILYDYVASPGAPRRDLHADAQGSVVALSDGSATMVAINSYDAWGNGDPEVTGRFGYTGQAFIPELGVYYYKARIYAPRIGRFLQTDPVGYDDQINLYAYVANDPVNKTDPTGNESASYSLTGRGPDLSPPSLEDVAYFLDAVADVSNGIPDGVIVGKPLAAIAGIIRAGSGEARVAATAAKAADAAVKEAGTTRAASRAAMREAGIPTSQQAVSQGRNASGRFREYNTPAPGGGTQRKAVVESTMDRSHPGQPHVEAGRVKTDPVTGATRTNDYGAPRLENSKCKVNVTSGC